MDNQNIIKGVLITPNQEGTQPREYDFEEYGDYKRYYSLLDCDCFDIQTRKFNGVYYDIYVDDEGLLKENNEVSVLTIDERSGKVVEAIVGNVFICKSNEEGQTISLTEEDVQNVLKTIATLKKDNHKVCVASI